MNVSFKAILPVEAKTDHGKLDDLHDVLEKKRKEGKKIIQKKRA